MSSTFSENEINEKIAEFPGWEYGEDGMLHKEFTFDNFTQAILFANAVGHLAEADNHHPDLYIYDYKNLRISMKSHDVDGITQRDLKLVQQISLLPRRT